MTEMAKGNITFHNLRINLNNEQHRRVHRVLKDLNTDVHKSVNQFLIDAADYYITMLQEGVTKEEKKSAESQYITWDDMDRIRKEIKDEMQREIIMVLGTALAGGQVNKMQEVKKVREYKAEEQEESADTTMVGLADMWG